MVSWAKLFRPTFRRTDHYYGFALSRSRFAPVCGFFGGFATFIDAAAFPLLCEEGNIPNSTSRQFVHTIYDRPQMSRNISGGHRPPLQFLCRLFSSTCE